MPSFGDIMDAVDLLKVDAVVVDGDRCVAIRNRNSKCRRCVDACIADAITVQRNDVTVDASACVNCGCCAAACPMDALSMVEPSSASVSLRMRETASIRCGMVVVACSRAAATGSGDPDRYAEVPCLGHISQLQLMQAVRDGLEDIVLVDGDCSTCKYGAALAALDSVIDEVADLLEASGSDAMVSRASEFPPELMLEKGASLRGKSRRGLARQTGGYMRKVIENAARKTIDGQMPVVDDAVARRRKRIASNGKLPTVTPSGNHELIDAVLSLSAKGGDLEGAPEGDIHTNRFGMLSIDVEQCSGCGMCVLFCPTDALTYDDYGSPDDPDMRYIEFRSADCTQCMLCRDVCLKRCVEVSNCVDIQDICNLEPKVMEIPRSGVRKHIGI